MKKRIICLALASAFALGIFGGCGNKKSPLSFNNAFSLYSTEDVGYTDKDPSVGYKEKLSYSVKNSDKDYPFKKDNSISNEEITFSLEGTYTAALEVIAGFPAEISTDIVKPDTAAVYHYTTEFNVSVDYTFPKNPENNYSHDDVIKTETYFLPFGESFVPVYSKAENDYTNVNLSSSKFCLAVKSRTEVFYNSASYTMSTRAVEYKTTDTAKNLDDCELKTNSYEYSAKTVIDNSQLIFALRNINLAVDATYIVPTVAAVYGEATDLIVKNKQEFTEHISGVGYKLNGAEKTVDGDIALKEMTYSVNSTKNSGTSQYVYVQKGAVKNGDEVLLPSIAVPYRIVSPLIGYGSFTYLGSLVYSLTGVEISAADRNA